MNMTTNTQPIPDRSSPGSTRTALSIGTDHQDGGVKCDTGATDTRIRARNNITIGTWNVRTLRAEGKLEELAHEMDRYLWHIRAM